MKKLLLFFFLTLVFGLLADFSAQAANCVPGELCQGDISPGVVMPGGSFAVSCDYGYQGAGIEAVMGAGRCVFGGFLGTAALYNCTADGTKIGTFDNSCALDAGSPYPAGNDPIPSLTVADNITSAVNLQESIVQNLGQTATGVPVTTAWQWQYDEGTAPGTASGTTQEPIQNPSLDGSSRQFIVNFQDYGGERYSTNIGLDTASTHFVYDTWVYFNDPSAVWNLELDMNQVLANGNTVILATQCSGHHGFWEYTFNENGTPLAPDNWYESSIPCNPGTWSADTWHHVQIASHRVNDTGVVQYDWVSVDGVQTAFPDTGYNNGQTTSIYNLGWTPVGLLKLNFQIEGNGSGSATFYADKLRVDRW